MNSDIQIIHTLSDDPADCSPDVVVSITAQEFVRVKSSIRQYLSTTQ